MDVLEDLGAKMLVLHDNSATIMKYDEKIMSEHVLSGATVMIGMSEDDIKSYCCWPRLPD